MSLFLVLKEVLGSQNSQTIFQLCFMYQRGVHLFWTTHIPICGVRLLIVPFHLTDYGLFEPFSSTYIYKYLYIYIYICKRNLYVLCDASLSSSTWTDVLQSSIHSLNTSKRFRNF